MIAWLDCRVGVAGDMLLGALVDVGADVAAVESAVREVTAGAAEVVFDRVTRAGFAAVKTTVTTASADGAAGHGSHRGVAEITAMIDSADMAADVAATAREVFAAIGEVEARRHGCAVDDVRFHEVGALDTIADVVGCLAAWHSLGWPTATSSIVGLGSGMVTAAHGPMSVPAPAVTDLLAQAGAPTWAGPLPLEATTPTGAALVARLANSWGDLPAMIVTGQGFGAGSADPPGVANLTRVVIGEAVTGPGTRGTEQVVELRCNVDDLDPRVWPSVLEALLAEGALDVWLTPATMKHGRPAQVLTVLCRPADTPDMRRRIFELTPTFGVRWQALDREVLDRHWQQVEVQGRPLAVKVGRRGQEVVTVQPEWRDVERVAGELGLPARVVLQRAKDAVTNLT